MDFFQMGQKMNERTLTDREEEGKDLLFFFGFRAAADNGRVDSEVGSQEHCVDGRYKKLPLVIASGSGSSGDFGDVIQIKVASAKKKFRVQPCESALIWDTQTLKIFKDITISNLLIYPNLGSLL